MPYNMIFLPKTMYNSKPNIENIVGGIIEGDMNFRKKKKTSIFNKNQASKSKDDKLIDLGEKLEKMTLTKLKPGNITF